jgi:hypothetical protein
MPYQPCERWRARGAGHVGRALGAAAGSRTAPAVAMPPPPPRPPPQASCPNSLDAASCHAAAAVTHLVTGAEAQVAVAAPAAVVDARVQGGHVAVLAAQPVHAAGAPACRRSRRRGAAFTEQHRRRFRCWLPARSCHRCCRDRRQAAGACRRRRQRILVGCVACSAAPTQARHVSSAAPACPAHAAAAGASGGGRSSSRGSGGAAAAAAAALTGTRRRLRCTTPGARTAARARGRPTRPAAPAAPPWGCSRSAAARAAPARPRAPAPPPCLAPGARAWSPAGTSRTRCRPRTALGGGGGQRRPVGRQAPPLGGGSGGRPVVRAAALHPCCCCRAAGAALRPRT